MQIDLLKNIVSSISGPSSSGIVNLLYDKKNVNEFLIAKKLKLTINQTRNILYRLADEGIVSFIRKKDRKKGGWYIYFWTLSTGKGLLKFKDHVSKKIGILSNQLNIRKAERFYHCQNCNIESNEENALLYQYTCPECGEVMQLKDKAKEVETLEKEISKLNELLKNLEGEIGVIAKKDEVIRVRKHKAEEKKKSKERALKRKKRELETRKLKGKKGGKKNSSNGFMGKKLKKKFKNFFRKR